MSESTDREEALISKLTALRENAEYQLKSDGLSSLQRESINHKLADVGIQLKHATRRLAREQAKIL